MTALAFSPTHPLGLHGPNVSALGVGTWALGGPWTFDGRDAGWGEVDDAVSVTALHAVIDHGVRLIDTASAYGTGHSERVIGTRAGRAAELDPATRSWWPPSSGWSWTSSRGRVAARTFPPRLSVASAPTACGGSGGTASTSCSCTVVPRVPPGPRTWWPRSRSSSAKARSAGSAPPRTRPEVIEVFARSPHCLTVQTQANVFGWSTDVLAARSRPRTVRAGPLAVGHGSARWPLQRRASAGAGDVRLDTPWWNYFDDDAMGDWLSRLAFPSGSC